MRLFLVTCVIFILFSGHALALNWLIPSDSKCCDFARAVRVKYLKFYASSDISEIKNKYTIKFVPNGPGAPASASFEYTNRDYGTEVYYEFPSELVVGANYEVTITRKWNNEALNGYVIVGDQIPPSTPVITSPSSGTTHASVPNIVGSTSTDATSVACLKLPQTSVLCSATVSGTGQFTCSPSQSLPDGDYSILCRAIDMDDDRSSDAQLSFSISRDTTPPATPQISSPGNNDIISGTATQISVITESNAQILYSVDVAAFVTSPTRASASGEWTMTLDSKLSIGSHTIQVRAKDAAGNEGQTATITVHVATEPTLTIPVDSSRAPSSPKFAGTASAGSTVDIYVDGARYGSTTASESGEFSFSNGAPLSEGSSYTAFVKFSFSGSQSEASNIRSFAVATPKDPSCVCEFCASKKFKYPEQYCSDCP